MQVTIDIPDDLALRLTPPGEDLGRKLLEASTAQVYREGRLTTEEVRRGLGLASRSDVDAFLAKYGICDYTIEDFREDVAAMKRLRQHA